MTWDQVVMLIVLVAGYAWVIRMMLHWKRRDHVQVTTRKDPTINQDQMRADSIVKLASWQQPAAKGFEAQHKDRVVGVISPKGKAS